MIPTTNKTAGRALLTLSVLPVSLCKERVEDVQPAGEEHGQNVHQGFINSHPS